eukprot:TRINITY_DN6631_c0_g2_i1.p1 TRINITY_DN6631_c0_g2~~TRINITY_DN6631_c0_g2_i1.p1  ORF type:complete len:822 (-),score=243.00 TRINITY_DN6631_c0_g2_i1:341-2806(-)
MAQQYNTMSGVHGDMENFENYAYTNTASYDYAAYGSYTNSYSNGYAGYEMSAQSQAYNCQSWQQQPAWTNQDASYYGAAAAQGPAAAGFNLDDFSDMSDSEDGDSNEERAEMISTQKSEGSLAEPAEEPSPSNGSTGAPADDSDSSYYSSSESDDDSDSSDDESDAESSVSYFDIYDNSEGEEEDDEPRRKKSEDERALELELRQKALVEALSAARRHVNGPVEAKDVPTLNARELLRFRSGAAPCELVEQGITYATENAGQFLPKSSPKPKSNKKPAKRNSRQEKTTPQRSPEISKRKPSTSKWPRAEARKSSGSAKASEASKPALKASENSWVALQKARREQKDMDSDSDEQVQRRIKAILNKLTLEKFQQLLVQLLDCGISRSSHVKILIAEIFEKAITQHHFIDMYADLCVLLHKHFAASPVDDNPLFSFKKLLLQACQSSFERHLAPPKGLTELDPEERRLAESRYKLCMLGNIRLVGAILARKMLNPKVLLSILEELMSDPTPEALESLAALLTVVGSTFDVDEWTHRPVLNHVFERITTIVEKRECQPRERCLLQDVLELRAAGWQDRRPQKTERPTTLNEVAIKKLAEEDPFAALRGKVPQSKQTHRVAEQEALRKERVGNILKQQQQQLKQQLELAEQKKKQQDEEKHEKKEQEKSFDQKTFLSEIRKALIELRYSKDLSEFTARLAALPPPPDTEQASVITELLSSVSEESNPDDRSNGFKALASLFDSTALTNAGSAVAGGLASAIAPWRSEYFGEAIKTFVEEVCPDLKCDVPCLPKILSEELHPELMKLAHNGILKAEELKVLAGFKA